MPMHLTVSTYKCHDHVIVNGPSSVLLLLLAVAHAISAIPVCR